MQFKTRRIRSAGRMAVLERHERMGGFLLDLRGQQGTWHLRVDELES